jgi:phage terminase small subunit
MALTYKQQAFVNAYCGNATEAAIAAGYSADSAHVQGVRLLKDDNIMAAIKAREKEAQKPLIATREQRQRFWSEVMLDPSQEMQHRLKAAELLGKSECDFSERLQIDGSVEVTVGFLFDPAQRRALLAEVQDAEYEALPSESS